VPSPNAAPRFYRRLSEPLGAPVDVLVIGGGVAACSAALEASKHGAQILMVDKGIVARSGSSPTAGGASAVCLYEDDPATNPNADSRELLFDNIRAVGELMNDPRLVRVFVEESARRVLDTSEMGVAYVHTPDGRLRQHRTMGHVRPRTVTPVGGTRALLGALRRELLHRGVRVAERLAVTRLLKQGERVVGAVAMEVDGGEVHVLPARAVVLAGGSATALFPYQSASFVTTGDAWVLGFEAGARLANMEFMEFTLIPKAGKTVIPSGGISPYLAFGGKLYDRFGERVLKRYDPERMEATSRGTIVYAVYSEMKAGRGPVTNDPAEFDDDQWKEIREIAQRLESAGLDYRRETFEWVPALHTCMGGMIVDEHAWTGVPGLWAAGECSTTIHGANRLSSCAYPDCFVFGHRAGRTAAAWARKSESMPSPGPAVLALEADALRGQFHSSGEKPQAVYKQVQELMWSYGGLARDGAGLQKGIVELEALGALPLAVTDQASLVRALEVRNLQRSAELVLRAALTRMESRGQHHREDYPSRDDQNWLKWVVLERADSGVAIRAQPVPAAANDARVPALDS
jgi:succinate dehydrogenase/fumarate reductase flavoprotein subunit